MKIAFLSFYSGGVARGAETFVHELANRLAGTGGVTVYQGGAKLPLSSYQAVTVGIPVDWRQGDSRGTLARQVFADYRSRTIAVFARQALALMDEGTDVVVPVNGGWQTLLCRLWTWRRGKRMVVSGQSGPGWDDRINLFCRPDAFVALTAFQKQWAERNGLGVRTVQIPNGVDLEKFGRKVKPAKVALPRPVILCVAALEAGKRIDLTIRAVAGLKKGSLLVAGDGADKEKLLALGEKMLPGRFRILQAPHERTPAYYAAADLFTMVPVPCEAFGIVYLEAMAAGLPVVAPDDPIRREIVGRGGLYVNPESTEEYSRALDEALRVRWGDVPRRQAEKFSWDKIAVNYERLFRALIN